MGDGPKFRSRTSTRNKQAQALEEKSGATPVAAIADSCNTIPVSWGTLLGVRNTHYKAMELRFLEKGLV